MAPKFTKKPAKPIAKNLINPKTAPTKPIAKKPIAETAPTTKEKPIAKKPIAKTAPTRKEMPIAKTPMANKTPNDTDQPPEKNTKTDQLETDSYNDHLDNLKGMDSQLGFGILAYPYNTFLREMWNSRARLRPLMHQGPVLIPPY